MITRRQAAGSWSGRRSHSPWPSTITVSTIQTWTAIFVKIAIPDGTFPAGHTFEATVETATGNGEPWQRGLDPIHPSNLDGDIRTELRGACYNLSEATVYSVRVMLSVFNSSGDLLDIYITYTSVTTQTSTVTTGASTTYYWDTQTGNDSDDGQSAANAKLTLGSLDTSMGAGKSILLSSVIDPNHAALANYRYRDTTGNDGELGGGTRGGTASNWVRIAPAGASTEVRGYTALDGGWTLESGTTDVWKKTLDSSTLVEKVYDVTAGKTLPVYYKLLTSDAGGSYAIKANTLPGVYIVDADTTPVLYVRKYTDPTVSPANGQLIGAMKRGIAVDDVDYLLIEDVDFTMCGLVDNTATPVNDFAGGLWLVRCNFVILRRCRFDRAHLLLDACSYVLIDDCDFDQDNIWEALMDESVNDPYNGTVVKGWSGDKNSYRNNIGIEIDSCVAVEVRNSRLNQMQIVFYDNDPSAYVITPEALLLVNLTTTKHTDEFVECDNVDIRGLVVACCDTTDTHNFISFTPGESGVAWIVGNRIENPLLTAFKFGGTAYTNSNMRLEFVNNTVVMDRSRIAASDEDGALRWIGGPTGNAHFTNCLWVLNSPTYIVEHSTANANNNTTFDECLFYSTPGVIRWRYQNTNYDDDVVAPFLKGWQKVTTANPGEMELTNITTTVNPYPNGFNGSLSASVPTSRNYPGVTNVASTDEGTLPYGSFDLRT